MRCRLVCIVGLVLLHGDDAISASSQPQRFPWGSEARCSLNPAKPQGLHPAAYAELTTIALTHRITQGINHSVERGNVHGVDGTLNGASYTGAVDISVRCLTKTQIKSLLEHLATLGFAGWYRKEGQDDWTGPPHIHAVWAGCRLKPVLRRQVEAWLSGGNGLGSNRPYRFWQPTAAAKEKVRKLYAASS